MATIRSKVTIHLTTVGDITLDQLAVCSENPRALAEVKNIVCPPQQEIQLTHPQVTSEYYTSGIMIIPDPSNTDYFILRNHPNDTGLWLHSSNPSFISIAGYFNEMSIWWSAALGKTDTIVRFIWV